MAPSSHTEPGISYSSATHMLVQCDKICKRLAVRFDNNPRAGEPLTALLRKQIEVLAADVHKLKAQVAALCDVASATGPLHGAQGYLIPAELAQALACVKLRLMETNELIDFHNKVERSGGEGALNALFAASFILNRDRAREERRADYNQERLIRIGLEFRDIISHLLQSSDSSPVDVFQQLKPRIDDFCARLEKQSRPHYVHAYKTMTDTPYIIDVTGPTGSGSYSTVRKFNSRRTGEPLAIKTLHNVFSDKDTAKVLREIGVLEVCNHRNIVQLVEAFTVDDDDQSMHLVIAPWAPCTLASFLRLSDVKRSNRCPWFKPGSPESNSVIYRVLSELADAVGYLHAQSIKHKDLKPDNILLYREETGQVTPLITDFGVSKPYFPKAATNYKDSTYVYLAPEQHSMQASTLESDMWQLGCCFAQLLAVAKGGTRAYEQLEESFCRDDPNCSCCIAHEHGPFMETLAGICVPGSSAAFRRAYGIVIGMMELDPAARLNIEAVKTALAKLPGLNRA